MFAFFLFPLHDNLYLPFAIIIPGKGGFPCIETLCLFYQALERFIKFINIHISGFILSSFFHLRTISEGISPHLVQGSGFLSRTIQWPALVLPSRIRTPFFCISARSRFIVLSTSDKTSDISFTETRESFFVISHIFFCRSVSCTTDILPTSLVTLLVTLPTSFPTSFPTSLVTSLATELGTTYDIYHILGALLPVIVLFNDFPMASLVRTYTANELLFLHFSQNLLYGSMSKSCGSL